MAKMNSQNLSDFKAVAKLAKKLREESALLHQKADMLHRRAQKLHERLYEVDMIVMNKVQRQG